jgi:hypothetical protein
VADLWYEQTAGLWVQSHENLQAMTNYRVNHLDAVVAKGTATAPWPYLVGGGASVPEFERGNNDM